jgi:hypothetical protein
MRRWSKGTNNYYFTSSIWLEEAPWYIFFIENAIMWICHTLIPRIPLPSFIKIVREGEETNLKNYYGTVADLFHCYVCSPITSWSWKKIKHYDVSFPYKMLEEMIPDLIDQDWSVMDLDYDEMYIVADNKRHSDKIGDEFKEVYEKLKTIGEVRRKRIEQEEKRNADKGGLCDE